MAGTLDFRDALGWRRHDGGSDLTEVVVGDVRLKEGGESEDRPPRRALVDRTRSDPAASLQHGVQVDLQNERPSGFLGLECRAGRRGLMDSTLGSGDRVRGFKSRSRRSGFFLGFFLLPSSSFPTM